MCQCQWSSSSIKIAFIALNVHFLIRILWNLWFKVFLGGRGRWTLRAVQSTFILVTRQVLPLVARIIQTFQFFFVALRVLLNGGWKWRWISSWNREEGKHKSNVFSPSTIFFSLSIAFNNNLFIEKIHILLSHFGRRSCRIRERLYSSQVRTTDL